MSDEKLQSIAPIEGPQCSFEDQICLPPEAFYDDEEQICVDPGNSAAEYQKVEKSKIADLDQKKALVNKAKSFAEKAEVKKELRSEEKKEVASVSTPEVPLGIFKTLELSQERGGCIEATPLILFSVNINAQGAFFYFQDLLPKSESTKERKKKDAVIELASEPIAVACGDSDLARALVREERGNRAVQAVEVLERFFVGSRENISVSDPFPSALELLKTEVVFFKPEGVKERKKPEEKEEPQFQAASPVLREEVSSALEISLRGQVIEGHSSSSATQTPANFLRQLFPADPAVSGLLVFPFAFPFVEARGAIAFDGRSIKLALTRVTRGSDAHNSKGSGQQGGKGNSGQDKNRQRSFQ